MGLIKNKNSYFKNTSPECSLFSQDNHEIPIHKELLYQTELMRKMIKNVGFDSKIELICPSLSKEELETIVYFLYEGKILCAEQSAISQVSQNLTELFGFPFIQGEIFDTKESIFLPSPTKKRSRKGSRKQSLQERNMDPIGDYITEATIKIERDIDKEVSLIFVLHEAILHSGAFCQFPFRWIYHCHSSNFTRKETGKMHLCALYCCF